MAVSTLPEGWEELDNVVVKLSGHSGHHGQWWLYKLQTFMILCRCIIFDESLAKKKYRRIAMV